MEVAVAAGQAELSNMGQGSLHVDLVEESSSGAEQKRTYEGQAARLPGKRIPAPSHGVACRTVVLEQVSRPFGHQGCQEWATSSSCPFACSLRPSPVPSPVRVPSLSPVAPSPAVPSLPSLSSPAQPSQPALLLPSQPQPQPLVHSASTVRQVSEFC